MFVKNRLSVFRKPVLLLGKSIDKNKGNLYYVYIHEKREIMKYQQINKSKCYCITLCRAANAITAYYDEGLQSTGMTTKQFSLLLHLSRLEEASTGELADYVNLERSTVTRNLKILVEQGWVYDKAEPGKRNHRYAVTEAGQRKIEEADVIWEQLQENLNEMLGEDNMQALRSALYKIQELQKA